MPKSTLEQRVTAIEVQLQKLLKAQPKPLAADDWKSVVGICPPDDELMREIDAEGEAWRKAQRKPSRRKASAGRRR